jgi:hypothetical protein
MDKSKYLLKSDPEDDPDLWCAECDVLIAKVDDLPMANHLAKIHEDVNHNVD